MKSNIKKLALVGACAFAMAFPTDQASAQTETLNIGLDVTTLTIATTPQDMDLGTFLIVHDPGDDFIVRLSTVGVISTPDAPVTSVFAQTDAASLQPASVQVDVTPDIDQNIQMSMTIDAFADGNFDGTDGLDIINGGASEPLRLGMITGNSIDFTTAGGNAAANQQLEWNNGALVGVVETDLDGVFVVNFGLDVTVMGQPTSGVKAATFDVTFAF